MDDDEMRELDEWLEQRQGFKPLLHITMNIDPVAFNEAMARVNETLAHLALDQTWWNDQLGDIEGL